LSILSTPFGPARLEEGFLLRVRSDSGRAACWAVGWWQGRKAGVAVVLGLARAEGKASLLQEGCGEIRNDSLCASLGVAREAGRKLGRAPALFRKLWEAYAEGLREGLGGYAPVTPANLAAWDLLVASLPEAERLYGDPPSRGGSNAAAFGAARTRRGGSLLWLDPHVPLAPRGDLHLHRLVIRSPDYEACGLARAGSPFVLVGSAPRIAWTLCSSWLETVEERLRPGGRGRWWKPPGESRSLRPAFLRCPLPSEWAFRAARSRSAPALARSTSLAPPLAHTHMVAADGRGRIAWCLGAALGRGRGGPVDLGGRDGYLVQCNASPSYLRPGRRKSLLRNPFPEKGGEDASWRHVRAGKILEDLLEKKGGIGPSDLVGPALDTCDPAALRLVRAALEAGVPREFRKTLERFRGGAGAGSRRASLAYLLEGALLEVRPDLAGVLHLAGAMEAALAGLEGSLLSLCARRALARWRRLGRPAWGRLHGGRPGSADTLLARGGSPWGPETFGAGEGSLCPMVVRLTPAGSRAVFLDSGRRKAGPAVSLPAS